VDQEERIEAGFFCFDYSVREKVYPRSLGAIVRDQVATLGSCNGEPISRTAI
jgi:hypothetical protein